MFAQMINMNVQPGKDDEFKRVMDRLHELEAPKSGLLQTTIMRHKSDPSAVTVVVVFESEARAREREQDPSRGEQIGEIQAALSACLAGAPEFIDADVLKDVSFR